MDVDSEGLSATAVEALELGIEVFRFLFFLVSMI